MQISVKQLIIVGAAIISLLLIGTVYSCNKIDGLSAATAIYQSEAKANAGKIKILDAERTQNAKTIAEQKAKIKQITEDSGKPSQSEINKDKQIAALIAEKDKYKDLKDCPNALKAAEAALKVWPERLSETLAGKARDIAALNESWQKTLDAQTAISLSWESQYNEEHRLRLDANVVINETKSDLSWAKLVGTVKTGVIIAFVAYVLTTLLK